MKRVLILTIGFVLSVVVPALAAQSSARGGIRLNWQDNATNEAQYIVYRWQKSTRWSVLIQLPANTNTYIDRAVTRRRFYCYYVTAKNALGESQSTNQSCSYAP